MLFKFPFKQLEYLTPGALEVEVLIGDFDFRYQGLDAFDHFVEIAALAHSHDGTYLLTDALTSLLSYLVDSEWYEELHFLDQ